VIIDHQRYAQAVILRGQPIPWHDSAAYSGFCCQAQGLLRPDTTLLDLGALYDFFLASDDGLKKAMSARSRTGYPLKVLLAYETTTKKSLELASVLAQTSRQPLVLQIPSPMRWLAHAHHAAGTGSIDELTVDHGENAAMYVADWLRNLSALPVSLLLLDARPSVGVALPTVPLTAYSPVSNITDHYRWALGERNGGGVTVSGTSRIGVAVPPSYWLSTDTNPPVGEFLIADIPPHAVPETVLAQLARLT
jgi:hypothetical protein